MHLQYTIMDPTENITLLVTTAVVRSLQPRVAALLLQEEPSAEQVGFLEWNDGAQQPRLQMMGGEFCGNATMSLGAWLCRQEPLWLTHELLLDVSGTEEPVPCSVTPMPDCLLGTVSMPLPDSIQHCDFTLDGSKFTLPTVCFPGICHIIAPLGTVQRHQAEAALRQWAQALPYGAVGLLLFDEERMHFDPLVYVKGTGTFVWERGCGSGTAAIACYLSAQRQADQCLSLKQPGGTIAAVTTWEDDRVKTLTISGTVKVGKSKTMDMMI